MRTETARREADPSHSPTNWRRRMFAGMAAMPVWAVIAVSGWIVVTLAYSLVVPQEGTRLAIHPHAEVLDFSPATGPAGVQPPAPR